jgi:molybdate/tungstate transport system permease protein
MTDAKARHRRVAIVGGLLALHVLFYVWFGVTGRFEPFEFFSVLLLAANIIIAIRLLRSERDLLIGGGIMFLLGAHAFLGRHLAPDSLTSGAILMVNVIILYVGVKINTLLPARYWYSFVASYLALFYIFILRVPNLQAVLGKMGLSGVWNFFDTHLNVSGWFVSRIDNAEPLFLLFLLGLASTARSFRLLLCFWAIVISFTFCQPYAWESMIILLFILNAVFKCRGRVASTTAVVFLVCGLALVLLVLLPVLITLLGENMPSIEKELRSPAVRSALWMTARTATISTLILIAFTVPLAYAVSRLRFPGRALLLSFMDVPIIIPQSVAGIAILRVFGRQQYIGEMLYGAFGIHVDGTVIGICVAQIFVAMPFIAKTSIAAFDAVPQELETAARTLGASSWGGFRRIALPLASRGIFLGAVLAWARAAGEFGALMIVAQTPETAPVLAWKRFDSVGTIQTAPLVATILLFSLVMFFLLQFVSHALPSIHGKKEVAIETLA